VHHATAYAYGLIHIYAYACRHSNSQPNFYSYLYANSNGNTHRDSYAYHDC
jgi:hypothetical protein